MTYSDYQRAMNVHFWGVLHCTEAVLPHMRRRRGGRIINITSIGGLMAVPHLAPYSASKFAAVGYSDAVRAEVAKDGIRVTTVCPGLMRTGSFVNALMKGRHRAEFAWFGGFVSLPVVSIDADRAARRILAAAARRTTSTITPQARLAAVLDACCRTPWTADDDRRANASRAGWRERLRIVAGEGEPAAGDAADRDGAGGSRGRTEQRIVGDAIESTRCRVPACALLPHRPGTFTSAARARLCSTGCSPDVMAARSSCASKTPIPNDRRTRWCRAFSSRCTGLA
jgi:NAD(P)-dependent dehydrogenase (short-subunit alcohol dehydrogenase family)